MGPADALLFDCEVFTRLSSVGNGDIVACPLVTAVGQDRDAQTDTGDDVGCPRPRSGRGHDRAERMRSTPGCRPERSPPAGSLRFGGPSSPRGRHRTGRTRPVSRPEGHTGRRPISAPLSVPVPDRPGAPRPSGHGRGRCPNRRRNQPEGVILRRCTSATRARWDGDSLHFRSLSRVTISIVTYSTRACGDRVRLDKEPTRHPMRFAIKLPPSMRCLRCAAECRSPASRRRS